jgi:hypothetical protein
MPRYIDTEELLKVPNVRKVCEYDETGEFISYKAVPVEAIENAPTIEAEPVRHGRWVEDRTELVCSVCGARFSDEITMMNRNFEYADLKFCPECGAKMDGGAE